MVLRYLLSTIVACALISSCDGQQNTDPSTDVRLEISGKVTESGLNRGLGGVEVTLESYAGDSSSSLTPRKKLATAETDSLGVFRFPVTESGSYQVSVHKDGYTPGGSSQERLNSRITVTLNKAHPTRGLNFRLGRPAQISGVVLEKDTQKPVPGLSVIAHGYEFYGG